MIGVRGVAEIVVLMSLLAIPAWAQPAQSFEALGRAVKAGTGLRIEDHSGQTAEGRLKAVTADEIVIEQGSGEERRFRADAVRTVVRPRSRARVGALVGAAIGAAAGIPSISEDADAPVLTGLVGALAGVIVGGLMPNPQTLYRSPGTPATLTIAPAASRRGAGVALVVRW